MTLIEIKIQLENILKTFTIDDMYVISPLQIVKNKFGETLGWKTDADAEAWLTKESKNSDADIHEICTAKEISDALKEINRKTLRVENLKIEIMEREEQANIIFESNEKDFATKKITVEEFQANYKKLDEYKKQTSELRKTKRAAEDKTKEDKENFRRMKRTAKQMAANKTEFFKNEKLSLNFLFRVLFFKEISLQSVEGYVQRSTELIFNLHELDPSISSKTSEYRKTIIDYQLIKTNLEIKEVMESLVTPAHSARIIPARWKTILEETFSKPIPDMFGSLNYADVHTAEYDSEKNNGFCFSRSFAHRSYEDEVALLLLNEASQSNKYLTTQDQKVLFAMPDGVSATLLFRKKGEQMQKYFTQPLEIVTNLIEKSSGKRATRSYYLITDDYVIETDFVFSK